MNEGKSVALWTKYLPAIRILLKKSVTEEQRITLSKIELLVQFRNPEWKGRKQSECLPNRQRPL